MILIFSTPEHIYFETVEKELIERNEPYVLFNSQTFPFETQISYTFNGKGLETHLIFQDRVIQAHDIKAVWKRRLPPFDIPNHIDKKSHSYIRAKGQALLATLKKVLPHARWFPNANQSTDMLKPYQLFLAQKVGLSIPATYLGNHPEEIVAFANQYEKICLKGVQTSYTAEKIPLLKKIKLLLLGKWEKHIESQKYLVPRGFEVLAAPSLKVDSTYIKQHIKQATYCPATYQQYVDKAFELRITFVGDRIFPCAIHSQASIVSQADFRLEDYKTLKHEPYELPKDIEEKLRCFMQEADLDFGCIDMIVTPEGEHVFLEVNQDGQWRWVEEMTGMPIAKAIADSLCALPLSKPEVAKTRTSA